MKIGRGVSELWRVENLPLPLTWPMAYTTASTTVQAVIQDSNDEERVVDQRYWGPKGQCLQQAPSLVYMYTFKSFSEKVSCK